MARLPSPAAEPRRDAVTAGIVSRGLSAVVDVAVVLGLVVVVYAAQATTVFLLNPRGFVPPETTLSGFVSASMLVAVGYLTVSWALLGGTRGNRVIGLRVVTRAGAPPTLLRSAARAVLYVVFPLGLLWVVVSPQQSSVQDALLRTRVVYDWQAGHRLLTSRSDRGQR